jgi:putative ABC transport system permease protein
MKSYIGITGKYLRGQKRRSVLTVIGILLSTALITGIGTIYTSLFDANLRATIDDTGDYYAAVTNVSADQAGMLTGNVETEKAGAVRSLGFSAYAENREDDAAPPYKYLSLRALDGGAMDMLPYRLQEGRMPQAQGEIALDYWTLRYMDGVSLGGRITLDIGDRVLPDGTVVKDSRTFNPKERFDRKSTQEYTVVGLLKPDFVSTTNFAQAVTFLDTKTLPDTETCDVYLKLKSTSNIQQRVRAIVSAAGVDVSGKEEGAPAIQFNDRVLRLYAQSANSVLNDSVMTILFIVTALVMVATIAVIYNAFNISVVERVSQFGLLRCVGATPGQIRRIVFREALILGAIGIPLGVLCGTAAMGVVFHIVTLIAANVLLGGMRLVVSPMIVIGSILLSAVTIYLSAMFPARKAAKISPMEAVRGAGVLRKEKFRATDRRRVTLALFGAEGWMAWKNIGRNRKRFYVTTFSMVVSIVLFIVFSSLVGFAYGSGAVESGDMPIYTIWTHRSSERIKMSDAEYAALRQTEGVDYVLRLAQAAGDAAVPESKMNGKALSLLRGGEPDASGNVALHNTNLICCGGESADTLADKLGLRGLDREAFISGQGVILVNGASLYDNENKRSVLTGMTELRAGDSVSFALYDAESPDGRLKEPKRLAVLAVVDQGFAGMTRNQNGGVNMICSEKLYGDATDGQPFPTNVMIMMEDGADRAKIKAYLDSEIDPVYNISDSDEAAKSMRQAWTIIGIFLYGFVAVISLIGCLNIINTMSTNIIIRTRELSVMRAIGMFEGGLRKMIAWESVLYSAAAAVVGSAIGAAISYLLYHGITQARDFPWVFPWLQILVAVGAAALVAAISGFVPLKRINKGVIMEGIRGEE